MTEEPRPNESEKEFLNLAYNEFYNLFEEIISDDFNKLDSKLRLLKISKIFAVYTEIIRYEPIKMHIKNMKFVRPPFESELAGDFLRFIRNVFSHFSLFEKWEDIYLTKNLINWTFSKNSSIDRFLKKYTGRNDVGYRFWDSNNKKMTYVKINFPNKYENDIKIYLKDIISELEGIRFCVVLMNLILETQLEEKIHKNSFVIMARVGN